MTYYQLMVVPSTGRSARAVIGGAQEVDAHRPEQTLSMNGGRILKLLFKLHHLICLALLLYILDVAIGLALFCYGLTLGLVLVALRITHERDMRFAFGNQFQEH